MKKFSKVGKRVMALFIIALLNINTYATQSSNDGSAFVTKAEFDTLMEDFHIKMNEFESGLNAKIDDAIAGYIGGLSGESVVDLENYAKIYMNTMGVTQIEPIREIAFSEEYAYDTLILAQALWFCWGPRQSTGLLNATNFKHSSYWVYFQKSTAVLPSTDENRLKRAYLLNDSDGSVSGLVRNIKTRLLATQLKTANPGAGANFSTCSASFNDAVLSINKRDSIYTVGASYNRYYTGSSWTSEGSATQYTEQYNNGTYSYSGTEDNSLISQLCKATTNTAYNISKSDYEIRAMLTVDQGEQLSWGIENGEGTTLSAPSRPNARYAKPRSTSASVSAKKTAGSVAVNAGAPIYAGVPLCKAVDDGKVSFTITLTNADLGEIFISDNPTGFSNTTDPEPDVMFSVDGKNEANRWTTNNASSGNHNITFKATKDKVYWIKYIPNANGPKYTIGDKITEVMGG